ncbi:hypothetical protein PUN28_003556 [Cardiocondyla obscurior]|uniref:Uncharacterized protein n=1 Tax=Cardiocondyla obscurior TaxID=286306 RepID=A0AAW2GJG4_9HYME
MHISFVIKVFLFAVFYKIFYKITFYSESINFRLILFRFNFFSFSRLNICYSLFVFGVIVSLNTDFAYIYAPLQR